MTILDIFGFDIKKQIIQAIPMYISNNLVHEKVTVKNKKCEKKLENASFYKKERYYQYCYKDIVKKIFVKNTEC